MPEDVTPCPRCGCRPGADQGHPLSLCHTCQFVTDVENERRVLAPELPPDLPDDVLIVDGTPDPWHGGQQW